MLSSKVTHKKYSGSLLVGSCHLSLPSLGGTNLFLISFFRRQLQTGEKNGEQSPREKQFPSPNVQHSYCGMPPVERESPFSMVEQWISAEMTSSLESMMFTIFHCDGDSSDHCCRKHFARLQL